MNLENLISKYIDGELSVAEDAQLREILSKDSIARQKFDASLRLHTDLLNDAETIDVPIELYENTEDLVLMRILAESPDKRTRVLVPGYYSMAAAIALLFLLSIFQINDMKNFVAEGTFSKIAETGIDETIDDLVDAPSELVPDDTQINSSIISNTISTSSSKKFNLVNEESLIDNFFKSTNSEGINEELSSTEIELAENLLTYDIAINEENYFDETKKSLDAQNLKTNEVEQRNIELFVKKEINNSLQMQLMSDNIISTNNYQLTDYASYGIQSQLFNFNSYSNNDIEVMTMLGSDIIRRGFESEKDISVSHFSQSIAYRITEKNFIGAEFGFTEYNYSEEVRVFLPTTNQRQGGVEAFNPSEHNNLTGNYPFTYNRTKNLFWASGFYERLLWESADVSISGRIGAGASNDGMLGYTRAMVKYNIIGGIYLSAGAEGRMFSFETPSTFLNPGKTTISTITLIYGAQIRF